MGEGGDVQSHLHPIAHVHGQLLNKKDALLFIGSWVQSKKLEKTEFENATALSRFC
jgi:hypothetical protein